ncbi:MAG: biotin transporter BioY [Tessaracoccus sp.]|uniref:biotin transporter BioY n=1 Tax=Tessaracoccus sp. TaxID=1971211 RepID=UPI001EBF2375|nr:biotin transporter BioY [Tessaracoccus sp.]MBK7820828.1 biotin transporter BioY [Tessaracoccus sp.]
MTSHVDAPAARRAATPADLAYIAVFAALLAALSLTPAIPIGIVPVPITLQLTGVALAGLCLGWWRGAAAVGLYVLVGLAGLPVFAGGKAGIGVLFGPTGGYLVGFVLSAALIGYLAQNVVRRGLSASTVLWFFLACAVSRVVIVWPLGALGMARAAGMPVGTAFLTDLAFWVPDMIKYAIAAVLSLAVHKAFPRLLAR